MSRRGLVAGGDCLHSMDAGALEVRQRSDDGPSALDGGGGISNLAAVTFLFSTEPVAETCLGRVWDKDPTRPVLRQCTRGRTNGFFCGGHAKARELGEWDPPGHGSVPAIKEMLALRTAERRAIRASVGGGEPSDRGA